MSNYQWDSTFTELFERCVERYRQGDVDFENYYSAKDLAFLDSIGYQKREFFDFVEDFAREGVPTLTTAVQIASVRRDFLVEVMKGKKSGSVVPTSSLPAKTLELDGYVWLPRIIAKARAKLHGELDPDTMFCCGGDRAFLKRHDIAPSDFLRAVWAAGDDDEKIVAYVKHRGKKPKAAKAKA